MRIVLLLLLFGCEKDCPPAPSPQLAPMRRTVVLVDDVWNIERFRVKPTDQPQRFWLDGCDIVSQPKSRGWKDGDVAIRCVDRGLFLAFNCRTLTGPDNGVSFGYEREFYRVHCE